MPQLPIVYAPAGIDLRLPDPLRPPQAAADGLNFDISPAQGLVKRLGYQQKATDDLGYGLFVYEAQKAVELDVAGWGQFDFGVDEFGSPTSLGFGDVERTLVGLAVNPKYWTSGVVSITYTGTGTASVNVQCNASGSIVLTLTVDGSTVLTSDLGNGNEASPVTVQTLASAINAITDFTGSNTSTSNNVPAAFIDFVNAQALTADVQFDIGYGSWTTMNSPIASPLIETDAIKDRSTFENPTALNMNGVMYINSGNDNQLKYDNQNLYRSGLPQASQPSIAVDTGTGVSAGFSGTYSYQIRYKQIDAAANTLEGRASTASASTSNSAGPYAIDVTVNNLEAATGYNTNCAIVNGAQTSTNQGVGLERITVDDGSGGAHTLKAGDTAYFYNQSSSSYEALVVDTITTSTITVESATSITVADNTIISNNLRIQVFRTEAGGSTYKLVAEIPNDSFNTTQVYSDTLIDASLGALLGIPNSTKGTPPACKYGVVWKNQMILAGDPASTNTVYYSEFDDETNPENFPVLNAFETAQGTGTGAITGLAVLAQELIIFTEDAVYWGTGNLAADDITINVVSSNVGCVAQASVAYTDNALYFLSKQGVFELRPGGFRNFQLTKISDPLDPVFITGANNNFVKAEKRAIATIWERSRKYVLYMPDETQLSGERYGNSNSRIYAFDLDRKYWYPWSNILAMGGMVTINDDATDSTEDTLWFHTRELNNSSVVKRLYRMNYTYSEIDYVDHTDAINMTYRPQWDFMRNPRVQKSYTEMAIDSYRGYSQLAYTPTGTTTVSLFRDFDASTVEASFTFDFIAGDKEIVKALPWSPRRALGLEFSNNVRNEQILINGWTLEAFNYRTEIRR